MCDGDEDYGTEELGGAEGVQALEDFVGKNHTNAQKISKWFKLFDVVTASHPSQVLRYSPH